MMRKMARKKAELKELKRQVRRRSQGQSRKIAAAPEEVTKRIIEGGDGG